MFVFFSGANKSPAPFLICWPSVKTATLNVFTVSASSRAGLSNIRPRGQNWPVKDCDFVRWTALDHNGLHMWKISLREKIRTESWEGREQTNNKVNNKDESTIRYLLHRDADPTAGCEDRTCEKILRPRGQRGSLNKKRLKRLYCVYLASAVLSDRPNYTTAMFLLAVRRQGRSHETGRI